MPAKKAAKKATTLNHAKRADKATGGVLSSIKSFLKPKSQPPGGGTWGDHLLKKRKKRK